MERYAKIYWVAIVLFPFFVSVEAGGIFSKCRRSISVVPQPNTIHERLEQKDIGFQYPTYAANLRRERIKRHVKFVMRRAWQEEQMRSQENHA